LTEHQHRYVLIQQCCHVIVLPALPSAAVLTECVSQTLEGYEPKPIRKFRNRGLEAHLLDRTHGFASTPGRQHLASPSCDPRAWTSSFYSRIQDSYLCSPLVGHNNTIPFSLASARSASVTAIGDESGYVRFFSTAGSDPSPDASKVDVNIRLHDNAIMGLDFSDDDMRLASACGDRSARILDVATQSVAAELVEGHWDSIRQIGFQPGRANGSVVATSDRIGCIQIWDLRCSSESVRSFSTRHNGGIIQRDTRLDRFAVKTVNTIENAHSRTVEGITNPSSVTAIQWMPAGREHLLLTASEANASIKLWDTRYIKPRRQAEDRPLAATPEPSTHAWRSYGITSLALSADAARLYAVCKDSTVYAYSTNHLMLGHAPELVDGAIKRRPTGAEGLGPLYGLRHDMFRAQSFYVKCAIRRTPGAPELLAVGSSNHCAVLFPTDERYMRSIWNQRSHLPSEPGPGSGSGSGPIFTPSQSFSTPSSLLPGSSPIPIFREAGTPLIRGHFREVTVLSWSRDGRLVTASDDCFVRQWQEGRAGEAKHLRTVGEFGGERHMAGWADVGPDWDLDDDGDC
jgi:WD40 repeat protein